VCVDCRAGPLSWQNRHKCRVCNVYFCGGGVTSAGDAVCRCVTTYTHLHLHTPAPPHLHPTLTTNPLSTGMWHLAPLYSRVDSAGNTASIGPHPPPFKDLWWQCTDCLCPRHTSSAGSAAGGAVLYRRNSDSMLSRQSSDSSASLDNFHSHPISMAHGSTGSLERSHTQ
jgi:hypothetical protein